LKLKGVTLGCRTGFEVHVIPEVAQPLVKASRNLRIKALDIIQDLIKAIEKEAKKHTETVTKAKKTAENL